MNAGFLEIVFSLMLKRLKLCFLGPLLGLPGKNLSIYALMENKLRGFMSSPGVVFDERLSWGSHVRKVISKAGKRVGMLGRLRDNLTTHSANVVYISLIRPILEYCDTLWGCCGERNSQALEALQKRAGRIVAKTSRSSPAMDINNSQVAGACRKTS